jgi:hypothetical protein
MKARSVITKANAARRRAVRLRHLRWLARHRGGVPDDRHGRLLLTAALAWGMEGPDAHRWARWITADELRSIIDAVDAKPPRHWTSERIGQMIELTDEERERGQLWSIRPCDVGWCVVKERKRQRKNAYNRERNREQRRRQEMATDLDVREETILAALNTTWTPVSVLATKLAGARAWRAPDGQPISGKSLREIVRRCAGRLVARGLIESRTEVGHNGFPTRFVRRRDLEATDFVAGNNSTATPRRHRRAGNGRRMGTSASSRNVVSKSQKSCLPIL